jgi:hypothetical protein
MEEKMKMYDTADEMRIRREQTHVPVGAQIDLITLCSRFAEQYERAKPFINNYALNFTQLNEIEKAAEIGAEALETARIIFRASNSPASISSLKNIICSVNHARKAYESAISAQRKLYFDPKSDKDWENNKTPVESI